MFYQLPVQVHGLQEAGVQERLAEPVQRSGEEEEKKPPVQSPALLAGPQQHAHCGRPPAPGGPLGPATPQSGGRGTGLPVLQPPKVKELLDAGAQLQLQDLQDPL